MPSPAAAGSLRDRPAALVVGRLEPPCVAEAVRTAESRWRTEYAATVEQALRRLEGDNAFALVVLVVARRGAATAQQTQRLASAAPLARRVVLLGPWAEGEDRGEHRPTDVASVGWLEWPIRSARWASAIARGSAGSLDRPSTSTAAERMEAEWEPPSEALRGRALGVVSRSAVVIETIRLLGAAAGCGVWEARPGEAFGEPPPEAIVWDLVRGDRRELDELADARRVAAPRDVPTIALLGFPRPADLARLKDAGVDHVLGKPWLNADLLWLLDHCLGPRGAAR